MRVGWSFHTIRMETWLWRYFPKLFGFVMTFVGSWRYFAIPRRFRLRCYRANLLFEIWALVIWCTSLVVSKCKPDSILFCSCSPLFLSGNKLRTYQHFHGLVLFDSIIYFLAVKLDMSEYRKRVEETKEDLLHLHLQMHSNDSRTVGAENMKAERLQLVRQFRAKTLKARQVTVRLDSGAPR